jgi:hypothetical protein
MIKDLRKKITKRHQREIGGNLDDKDILLNVLYEDNSSLEEENGEDSWKSEKTSSPSDGMPNEDADRVEYDDNGEEVKGVPHSS